MRLTASIIAISCATQATAAPAVLTDIAPIHGLVSVVMGDVGTPELFLAPGVDVHSYAMTPSDAQTLANAELIIWVGADLISWLAEPIATLAPDAKKLELLETTGWTPREVDEHDGADDDHGEHDPHAWIDPQIASVWVGHIADVLAQADPENAATYQTNAADYTTELTELRASIATQLAPAGGQSIIWPHDAYGYFADAFGLTGVATIADAAANTPGPAHIAELRALPDVACILADPEVGDRWTAVIAEGTSAKTGMIDPVGAQFALGADHYRATVQAIADTISTCVAEK